MKALTDEKLTIVGAAGMIGSNMAQTALMMGLTSNICLYDPFAPALEGVAEEMFQSGFEYANITFTSDISVAQLKAYYQDKDWMLERLDRLEYDLSIMKRMSPYAAIHYLSNAMKYQDYLKDYAKEHHINEQELLDVLNAVHESSQSCRTFAEWFTYIDTYTEELQKQAKSPASKDANNESGVCLCTLHCAKGLEYPIVFIPDINEDNIPHARAAVDADLEEERRLFYVGITRAKEHLHLYCVGEASGKEKFPSRFLEELNEM